MPRPKHLTIEMQVELIDFEPDGSMCHICEETIWLPGKQAVFTDKFGVEIGRIHYKFCQGCSEMLEKQMKGESDGDEQYEL